MNRDVLASILRSSGSALAGVAAARFVTADETRAARYEPDPHASWRGALAALVGDLATSLDADDPALFAREVEWLRDGARARDVPPEDVGAAVVELERALGERLGGDAAPLVRPQFEAARAALAGSARADSVRPTRVVEAFLAQALGGDAAAARDDVLDAVAAGKLAPDRAVVDVLIPVLREAGRRWHAGSSTAAEEHVVTQAARAALTGLPRATPAGARRAPRGRTVLLCGVEGDAHDAGLTALGALLEIDGWRVTNTGGDTPHEGVARLARAVGADVVALSATLSRQRGSLSAAIASVRAEGVDARVLVGGAAVDGAATARELGADAFASSVEDAVARVADLAG